MKSIRHRRGRLLSESHKKAVVFCVVVILILGSASMLAKTLIDNRNKTQAEVRHQAFVSEVGKDNNLRKKANEQLAKNKNSNLDDVYMSEISKEPVAAQKVKLYLNQSSVLYTAAKYDEAIASAKKAETLQSDKFLVADWLSRIYEDRKDYKNAETYYKLAAVWASSMQNSTALDKSHFEQEAERVATLGKAK